MSAEDSPEELAAWLEQAWRQLRPAYGSRPGFGRPAVDEYVAHILERLRSADRLDPDEIRMAPMFPATIWSAAYEPRDVLELRAALADRVSRSRSVSTEALFTRADVPQAAVDIAEQIRVARFRVRPWARYDQRDVDAYLLNLERSLRRGQSVNSAEIRARRFSTAKGFAHGYVAKDVRRVLGLVAEYADSGS